MGYSELQRDLWFGLATLAFAIFFGVATILTVQVDPGETGVTARTFPYIITGILGVLSFVFIINTIKKLLKVQQDQKKYIPVLDKDEYKRAAIFLVSLFVYIICFIYVGYIVSSFAYMAFMLWHMKAKNRIAVILLTAITPFVLWYFFTVLVEVQFPEAILF